LSSSSSRQARSKETADSQTASDHESWAETKLTLAVAHSGRAN
jgi:hypothetical protein